MSHLVNGIAEAWFLYMTSSTYQATILALLILGVLRIGRRWPPALRHALLMLALCKFLIPPMLSLPTGMFNRIKPMQWSYAALPPRNIAPVLQVPLRPVERFTPYGPLKSSATDLKRLNERPGDMQVLPAITAKGYLMLLHISGALLILALIIIQKLRLRRLALRATPAQNPVLISIHDELCRSMKPFGRPRLLMSRDNHAPIAFGTWKPVVVLPEALLTALPLSGIRAILGHELAHHRRLDPWRAWLQLVLSALWWFNPVYWLLSRNIRSVLEDCCDDMVLASELASREAYCRTLLQAARAALGDKAVSRMAFAYMGKSQALRRRFMRIMSAKCIRPPKLAMTGILVIFALALVLLPGAEPRILAQSAVYAEAHALSIHPARQETAAILQNLDKASNAESSSPDEKQLRPELPGKPHKVHQLSESRQGPQSSQEETISDYYRKWLDEDVVYIIELWEKSSFLALKTDKERDLFIERFWVRRNTDPGSERNAFKMEHYRRIAYANEHFACSVPGWKTDRGRVYILFGKPDEIESHPKGGAYRTDNRTVETFPFEKWWFRHIEAVGDDIEIEFVDPLGTGEYQMARSPDEKATKANDALSASLTFDVRTEYIKQSTGKVLVRIAIELRNEDLEFIKEQGLNRAVINLQGLVAGLTGKIMSEWEDAISVEYLDQVLEEGKSKRTNYEKILELPPGQRFKLDLVMKDINSRKTGTQSRELKVPIS
jgi:GWxTD domain-containing protein